MASEQELIKSFEKIVFLYPVHWYDYPHAAKAYIDAVIPMSYGGLKGRTFMQVSTTGAAKHVYEKYTPPGLLTNNCNALAGFTGMSSEPAFIFYADDKDEKAQELRTQLAK